MPVTDLHPSYSLYSDQWQTCRDVYEGSDAVKAKGQRYLPRLTGQTDLEYAMYKQRALFYGITSKTVSALVGMASSKSPKVAVPDQMDPYFTDQGGMQFLELWVNTLVDLLLIGRIGALVDAPADGGDPYVTLYPCENIRNWSVDDEGHLVMVTLFESFYVPSGTDEFSQVLKQQYRVLRLVDGVYTVQIYDETGQATGLPQVPQFAGKSMDYIPFFICNPFGLNSAMVKSPMLDIVSINLSHYMSSADLEHGRHFTGLPTPVAIGVDSGSTLHIGSMTAWIIPDPSGDAKYLEFTGQGLQSLEKALTEKQTQLASLSARFIDNSSRGSEAVDAVRLRFLSETSSLLTHVLATEALFNAVYKTVADIKGIDRDQVSITMNKDFLASRLSAKDVLDLISGYIQGGMSKDTLVFNLQRGEVLAPDRSVEDEIKAIKEPTPQPASTTITQ